MCSVFLIRCLTGEVVLVHAYGEFIVVPYESTVLLIIRYSGYFRGWANSNCLLRNELVYELAIRGVSSEGDVSLFHIVSCSVLCWENRPPMDSVILRRLTIEENYEFISKVVDELEILVHLAARLCRCRQACVCVCVCVCVCIYQPIHLPAYYLPVCLSVRPSVRSSIHPIYLSICLSIHLSIYLRSVTRLSYFFR